MALSVVPPALPALSSHAALPVLRRLCRDLRRQGWAALIVLYSNCGDVDVRVQVTCGSAQVVELLGPCDGCPDGPCWHAVRIRPDHRSIWCGPPKSCRYQRLVEFVTDVLVERSDSLSSRYQAR